MTEPKSECKCIDCNLPDLGIESLGWVPAFTCLKCDMTFPSYMQTEFDGHVAACTYIKPEQPNQNITLVKTIQGLMTCVSNDLDKLRINTINLSDAKPLIIAKALEEIGLFEKTTLYELQKAFE